jgi:trypsin
LRSAHVGRWNQDEWDEDYEEFEILYPEYVHPLYTDEDFPYDLLLLKLDGLSTKPYIQLNEDPDLPTGLRVDEVTSLGFGNTDPQDSLSLSRILQEVDLTYIPNDVCELSKSPGVSDDYQGLITDDMLCARDNGQDSCQGDSGGPLIINRGIAQRDVLIGVISWCVPNF